MEGKRKESRERNLKKRRIRSMWYRGVILISLLGLNSHTCLSHRVHPGSPLQYHFYIQFR
jgi:hypothetical protein